MKLEKRDIAEALGLVYNGSVEGLHGDYYHTFDFHGEILQFYKCSHHTFTTSLPTPNWNPVEDAWEQAANKVLEPLVELLKERM